MKRLYIVIALVTSLIVLASCTEKTVEDTDYLDSNNNDTEELVEEIQRDIVDDKDVVESNEVEIEEVPLKRVRILAAKLNVRAKATMDSEIVDVILEREEIDVYEITEDIENRVWYKIKVNKEVKGWIAGWYTSEVYKDAQIGGYVSLVSVNVPNAKLQNFDVNKLNQTGDIILSDEWEGDFESYEKQVVTTDSVSVEYAKEITIESNVPDVGNMLCASFFDEETLIYWIYLEDDKFYLIKRNIYDDIIEILYSLQIDNFSISSTWYSMSIDSISNQHIIYRIKNDVIIYEFDDDIVAKHYRYAGNAEKSLKVNSVSTEGEYISIQYDYDCYVTGYDLSETRYIIKKNDSERNQWSSSYVSFSMNDSTILNVSEYGYEWLEGEYVLDTSTGSILELRAITDNDNWGDAWAWEASYEYPNNKYVIYIVSYEESRNLVTAILDNRSEMVYLDGEYYVDDYKGTSYSLGIPMYNDEMELRFINVEDRVETEIQGIPDGGELICGVRNCSRVLILHEGEYSVYDRK